MVPLMEKSSSSCFLLWFRLSLSSVNCCWPPLGTEKVRQGQGYKHLHVVNPDWLWSCLERWERVDEQLYPLKDDYSKTPRYASPSLITL